MIFELINFNMYLMLVAKNEKLAKWMLINQCFKDSTVKGHDLESVRNDDINLLKLKECFTRDTLEI
jgi:hypothetical protein